MYHPSKTIFEDWAVYAPHFEVSFRSLTWQVFLKTVYAAVLQVSFRSLTWQVFLRTVYAAVLQVSLRNLTWLVLIKTLCTAILSLTKSHVFIIFEVILKIILQGRF